MDTSSLNVEVEPTYIRCVVKDKVTQIHWPEEMLIEKAVIQRSQTTGALCITATKANVDLIMTKQKRDAEWREERRKRDLETKLHNELEAAKQGAGAEAESGEKVKTTSDALLKMGTEDSYTYAFPAAKEPKEKFVADFDEDDCPPLM